MRFLFKNRLFLSLLCLLAGLLSGCNNDVSLRPNKKEILIYCGTAMAHAVRDIADVFEERNDCIVKIIQEGSGLLHRSIHINNAGDLFFPGSESYLEACTAKGVVTETKLLGFNRAALFVAKGNLLKIPVDLNSLTNPKYRTALGVPATGAVGKETKRILSDAGIFEPAMEHALYLAHDAKDLGRFLREDKIDVTINWVAAAHWKENKQRVDVLLLDEAVAPAHKLVIGLLKYSHHPDLAIKFMNLAASAEGQAVFARYGLGQ